MTENDTMTIPQDLTIIPVKVPHPGVILRKEFLQPLKITPNRLSTELKVPANRVYGILSGKRGISVNVAYRLAVFFGNSPQFWLNLQNGWEMHLERRRLNSLKKSIIPWSELQQLDAEGKKPVRRRPRPIKVRPKELALA